MIDARSVAVIALGICAAVIDWRTRRVPNALTLGASAVGLAFAIADRGASGLGWSLGGWAVGLLVFLPLFALRALGGGDVKLLAAFGAWLGPERVLWVAVYGAIAGGVLAVPFLLWRRRVGATVANLSSLLLHFRIMGLKPHPTVTLDNRESLRMPYALPIALGALATLWLRVW